MGWIKATRKKYPQRVLAPTLQRGSQFTGAQIAYALQAVSFFAGGLPLLVALIIGYLKRSEVQCVWLESHFTWQIRTFWYSLL